MKAKEFAGDRSLGDYLTIVRRRWRLIAVSSLLLSALAFAYSNSKPRLYTSGSEVLVDFQSATSYVDSVGQQYFADQQRLLENEVRYANSQAVLDRLSATLGYEPDNVGASGATETADVLQFVSVNADPAAAATEANAYAEVYRTARSQRVSDNYLQAVSGVDDLLTSLRDELGKLDDTDPATEQRREVLDQQIQFYDQLSDSLNLSAQVGQASGVAIISQAFEPTAPVSPQPLRTAGLALVLGFLLGLGAALLLELLDDTLRTSADVERHAEGVALLGAIPKDQKSARLTPASDETASELNEAFRSLRTSVQFVGLRSPLRAIQVTSANASEGKTTVASFLAMAFSEGGDKVVLIDGDLRNPSQSGRFGIRTEPGLANVMMGTTTLNDALVKVHPTHELYVLPSGPLTGNAADLLWSANAPDSDVSLPSIVRGLTSAGYLVVVDCPPVLPVADALTISRVVDGTLFVVTAGSTGAQALERALEQLRHAEARIVGIALNAVDMKGSAYGYGYGYGNQPKTRKDKVLARLGLWKPPVRPVRAEAVLPAITRPSAVAQPTAASAAPVSNGVEPVDPQPETTARNQVVDLVEVAAEPKAAPVRAKAKTGTRLSNGSSHGQRDATSRAASASAGEGANGKEGVPDADAVLIKRLRDHLGVGDGAA